MTKQEMIDYGVSIGWLTPEKAEQLKNDFPDIVRCKNCVYGEHHNGKILCMKNYCDDGDVIHEDMWFCADGKQKDGEQDGL